MPLYIWYKTTPYLNVLLVTYLDQMVKTFRIFQKLWQIGHSNNHYQYMIMFTLHEIKGDDSEK